jgi:hypothetical protein
MSLKFIPLKSSVSLITIPAPPFIMFSLNQDVAGVEDLKAKKNPSP